jgi:hypothetical protein
MHYGRELTHICRYTGTLDLTWVRKELFFRSVTFQNLVKNSCNTELITHLQVDLPLQNLISHVD